jgi:cell division protein FtsQ
VSTPETVSDGLLKRLAERSRIRRWSRTKLVLVVVALGALIGVLAWVVLGSSLLAVRTVEVIGADAAVSEEVGEIADAEIGTPLARLDLAALEQDVEQIRTVLSASVERAWPRTLRIVVDIREPAAVTKTPNGFDVVDRTGAVLSSSPERPRDLPLVVVGTGTGARLVDGLTVLDAAPPRVQRRTTRVNVVSEQDIRLRLDGDVEVRWGSVESSPRKAEVLAALLGQKAQVYDVSAPDLPTTRG